MGNKNTLIGILLISVLFMLLMYNSAVKKQQELEKTAQLSAENPEEIAQKEDTTTLQKTELLAGGSNILEDSIDIEEIANQSITNEFGIFANAAIGDEEFFILENNHLKATISTKGAQIVEVELKDFKTYDKQALLLISNSQNLNFNFSTKDNKSINTADLYFSGIEKSGSTISLKASDNNNGFIEMTYSLPENSYLLDYDLKFNNLNDVIAEESVKAKWNYQARSQEQNLEREKQKSTIFYKMNNGEVEHLTAGASKNDAPKDNLEWLSFKQQFFNTALLSKGDLKNTKIESVIDLKDSSEVATFNADFELAFSNSENINEYELQYFFGPNNFKMLKKMDRGLEEVVELSYDFILFRWVKYINKWIILPIFNSVEKVISNYGIVILIMTLIIKMLLMPLTFKSYVSTAKQKLLKPELDELRAKFKDDQQGFATAQMKLYQETGVSMFGGCLPMLLQMPFLLAMFYFFPSSIELRQQSFLWANDLSTYDNIMNLPFTIPLYGSHISLFTLLMTISSLVMAKFNTQMQSQPTQPGMEMMKYMPYVFPFFLMFLFNSWPAALTYYYFLSNIITLGQQFAINKFFIDEDKLREQIENYKKTPKKKSGFASKMEEIYKQQQELQKNKNNKK